MPAAAPTKTIQEQISNNTNGIVMGVNRLEGLTASIKGHTNKLILKADSIVGEISILSTQLESIKVILEGISKFFVNAVPVTDPDITNKLVDFEPKIDITKIDFGGGGGGGGSVVRAIGILDGNQKIWHTLYADALILHGAAFVDIHAILVIINETINQLILDTLEMNVTLSELLQSIFDILVEIFNKTGGGGGGGAGDPGLTGAGIIIASNDADRIIEELQAIQEVNWEINSWLERMFDLQEAAAITLVPRKKTSKVGEEDDTGGADNLFTIGGGIAAVFGSIGSLMNLFNVWDSVLKAFEPTIEIIKDLFTVFGDIMAATIMPVLQPLNDALIGIMPLFAEMGEVLGGMIAEVLGVFIGVLLQFMPIIEPLLEVFMSLMQVGLLPLKILLQVLEPILGLLLPHIDNFATFLGGLAGFIIDVANAFIDFINAIDVFNWFPDLQKLEKIDLGTKQEDMINQGEKQLSEQEKTNALLGDLVTASKPDADPITVFISPTTTTNRRTRVRFTE